MPRTAVANSVDNLQEFQEQAAHCLDVKVQIDTLMDVLNDFSNLLREEVESRNNQGFTLTVPEKGKIIARAAVQGGVVGQKLEVDESVFIRLPSREKKRLFDSQLLRWVDTVRSPRSAAITYQPNV